MDDFKFGVATSAYQIEGAWDEDGKAPSIWDDISHHKHKMYHIKNFHTGDIACDHYHRYKEDVALMKELGIQTYRFSISWSRICTRKNMCSNLKGISFYKNLVKELIDNDIEPFITLYHWDLPSWLNDLGGWGASESIKYFKTYAETMFEALPDVKHWITFNEPAVFVRNYWGHDSLPQAIRNVLIAHGETVKNYKKLYKDKKIGISLNLIPIYPNVYNSKDQLAAKNMDKIHNRIWLDPIMKGKLPDNINQLFGYKNKIKFSEEELKTISTPIDYLGINYYTAIRVKHILKPPTFFQIVSNGTAERDEINTEIHPYGLLHLCEKIKKDYNNPEMYITENGMAGSDVFVHDKGIHDIERIRYIREHLKYCYQAIKKGCKLRGYFYWSFMDNFEWLFGYNKRFGLIYVFYPLQSRVAKDSFQYYKKIITDKDFREKQIGEL